MNTKAEYSSTRVLSSAQHGTEPTAAPRGSWHALAYPTAICAMKVNGQLFL